MSNLQQEIAYLNQRIEALENIVRQVVQRTYRIEVALNLVEKPAAAPAPTVSVPEEDRLTAGLQTDRLTAGLQTAAGVEPRPPEISPPPSVAKPAPRTTTDWETVIGGKWAQWVGTAAILLALAFFLAYSFRWVGPVGRVLIGLLGGLLFLAGGEFTQARPARWFSQGLTGGGLAILYLTLYAAYNAYHLLAMPSAFGLMILVTTAGVALSVRYHALSTIALATFGGFLTPVLVRETPLPGVGAATNALPFLTYVAVLNGGILAVSAFQNWRAMNLLVFVAAVLLVTGWLTDSYRDELRWITFAFVTVYFLIFVAIGCLYNLLRQKPTDAADLTLIFATVAVYFGGGYWLLHEPLRNVAGVFPLLLCAFYLGLGYQAIRLVPRDRGLALAWLGIALTLLTIAIPVQLRGHWITVAWAVEAAVLTFLGFSLQSPPTRHAAALVWAMVVFRLLFFPVTLDATTWMLLLNKRFLTFAAAIAATVVMACLYHRNRAQLTEVERPGVTVFGLAANVLAVWILTAETYDFFRQQQFPTPTAWQNAAQLGVSLVWTVYSALVLLGGMVYRYQPARLFALVLFGVTIFKVFLFDLSFLSTPSRILSFGGLGGVLILVSWLYSRFRVQIREWALGKEEETP